jgi:cell division transport system permease protein
MISIGTITISMLLLGSFLLLSVNISSWLSDWGGALSMSVYIEDGLDKSTRGKIETALSGLGGAEITRFITKEQALSNLKSSLGDQVGLLEGLKVNPLPASYEIVFHETGENKVDPVKIKSVLEKIEGVNEVQYSEQWLERFKGIMNVFRIVGLVIGGFLCLAVLFITTNTIKLTIYSRRDEIEIYKLVGATDWFVKLPYLIEGAIEGLFGGILSFIILLLIYTVFSVKTVQVFGLPVIDFAFLSFEHSIFLIFLSIALGFIGGLIAIGRFFKV